MGIENNVLLEAAKRKVEGYRSSTEMGTAEFACLVFEELASSLGLKFVENYPIGPIPDFSDPAVKRLNKYTYTHLLKPRE